MLRIIISVPARLDLREHFDYLADRNYDKALTFFDAARQTFADLANRREAPRSPEGERRDESQGR